MTDDTEEVEPSAAPPAAPFRAKLTILLIGAVALGGIVLMCLTVLFFAIRS
jgi:hypothetical protein